MSWIIDGITLPRNPFQVKIGGGTKGKDILYPRESPIILSMGKDVEVLTIEGWFAAEGKTADQIETDYLIPFNNKRSKEVTLDAPGTRYDGDGVTKPKWVLWTFHYIEKAGFVTAFQYTMELHRGKKNVVI